MESITIADALTAGIEMIDNPTWRRGQHNTRKAGWDKWQSEQHPELHLWNQLLPGHVFEYHKWLRSLYRPATVNNYVNPVRKAATWIKLYHPELSRELFVRNVTRTQHRPTAKRYLMPDQLAHAAQEARTAGEPAVVAALMFGGLAGLDIGEIMRIQAGDIKGNVISVRGEKNDYRPRVVPMCDTLAQFAHSWCQVFSKMPIKTDGALSHKARKVLSGCAEATKDTTYGLCTLHDSTRVTFVNIALQAGSENEYVRAYIGHAPETVMAKHYADLTPRKEDMPRILNAKIEQLQIRVVAGIEKNLHGVSFLS